VRALVDRVLARFTGWSLDLSFLFFIVGR
jgi:hypothetical protein